MPAEWRIVPLDRKHDRSAFDCGEPALNDYLARYARQNQGSGIARTFVAVEDEAPSRILGYYSLTVGGIDRANLSPEAKALPELSASRRPPGTAGRRSWRASARDSESTC